MICPHGDAPERCEACLQDRIRARQREERLSKLAQQTFKIFCIACGTQLLPEDDWCMNIQKDGRYCGRLAPKYTRKA